MNCRKFVGVAVASALFAAGATHAGDRRNVPVTIDLTRSSANGSLGGARASADSVQSIGCATNAVTSLMGSCTARNSAGLIRTCVTTLAHHLQVISTLQSDSQLSFWWDTSGTCIRITVWNDSMQIPKIP